ncbi:hypothetical protein DFH09DRAFT_1473669 [Mycena vulgaris]|nr:hypothetical protein DFH09DRAFT_1473669 [Mycena vulgaris]
MAGNIAYILFSLRLPEEYKLISGRQAARRKAAANQEPAPKISFAHTLVDPCGYLDPSYFSAATSGSLHRAYLSITPDLITETRGTSRSDAGYTSSVNQIIPKFLTPCVGALFDRYGRRMYYVSATAPLWIIVYSLMSFTQVHSMVPAILGSIALSFNAIPFIAAIPLLAPSRENLGTAFGIWKAFNSADTVIMDVSAGAIQDRTPAATHTYVYHFESDSIFAKPLQLRQRLYFLIAIKAIDGVYGLLYHVPDVRCFGSVLRMSEAEKLRDVQRQESDARAYVLQKPVKLWTMFGFGVMFSIAVIARVLYLVYYQGS